MNLPVRKAHADLGASKAERWMNCAGSVALESGLPDRSTPEAREGTAAHELARRALERRLDPASWVGAEIPVSYVENGVELVDHFEVTEDMADAVRVFVDYVWSRVDHPSCELFVERRFDLSRLNPPGPMYGTADAVVWNPRTRLLDVCDLKYGRGVIVDVTENAQCRYYALGSVLSLDQRPARIRSTIVQPRGYHPEGVVRSEEFDFAALVDFRDELLAAARATLDRDAPLVVGDWCRFCKALPVCPAQAREATAVARVEFDALDAPEPTFPAPETLDADTLSRVLYFAPCFRHWVDAIEQWIAARIDRGEPVPGWKLVPKRATRRWADPEGALVKLAEVGVDADALYTKKPVSPAQAEKLLKPFSLTFDEIEIEVLKTSSGSTLVPDADARPALVPSAQADFAIPAEEAVPPRDTRKPRRKR